MLKIDLPSQPIIESKRRYNLRLYLLLVISLIGLAGCKATDQDATTKEPKPPISAPIPTVEPTKKAYEEQMLAISPERQTQLINLINQVLASYGSPAMDIDVAYFGQEKQEKLMGGTKITDGLTIPNPTSGADALVLFDQSENNQILLDFLQEQVPSGPSREQLAEALYKINAYHEAFHLLSLNENVSTNENPIFSYSNEEVGGTVHCLPARLIFQNPYLTIFLRLQDGDKYQSYESLADIEEMVVSALTYRQMQLNNDDLALQVLQAADPFINSGRFVLNLLSADDITQLIEAKKTSDPTAAYNLLYTRFLRRAMSLGMIDSNNQETKFLFYKLLTSIANPQSVIDTQTEYYFKQSIVEIYFGIGAKFEELEPKQQQIIDQLFIELVTSQPKLNQ